MTRILLLFLLSFSNPIFANDLGSRWNANTDWSSIRSLVLLKSKSPRELELGLRKVDALKALTELCQSQLRSHRLPVSCFALLSAERELGVARAERDSEAREQLEAICVFETKKIRRLTDEQVSLSPPEGSRCARALQEQKKRLAYANAFRSRESAFQARHRF